LLLPSIAFAYSAGISGYSGQGGQSCTTCHGSATATATLSGPTTLAPGASGSYTLTITGGPAQTAGLDVSLSGGGSLQHGTGTQLMSAEVTQTSPAAFSGSSAAFTFSLTAPSTAGTVTLYASGLSSNNDLAVTGDATGQTTLAIAVGDSPDGGTGHSSSSGCNSMGDVSFLAMGGALLVLFAARRAPVKK
jgi:hypothetical protein